MGQGAKGRAAGEVHGGAAGSGTEPGAAPGLDTGLGDRVEIIAIAGLPEVQPGDDLAAQIATAARAPGGPGLHDGDVLVVTQKVVSKAEGRLIDLRDIEPSPFASSLAARYNKDARHVEIVLRESARIVKMDRGVIISETHHGFICANAGVDNSNVPGDTILCLLPLDADASARALRDALRDRFGVDVAVVISDSFGRPWRNGITNVAIGVAGMAPLRDYRGELDPHGYELSVTVLATADELACAAELVTGKTTGRPVIVVRGYAYTPAEGSARALVMDPTKDLFR